MMVSIAAWMTQHLTKWRNLFPLQRFITPRYRWVSGDEFQELLASDALAVLLFRLE
jgi:hypothetical protein